MSKFDPLWIWIKEKGKDGLVLSFADIEKIAGTPIDNSFLNYKNELLDYGYRVGKISMKDNTVLFLKTGSVS